MFVGMRPIMRFISSGEGMPGVGVAPGFVILPLPRFPFAGVPNGVAL
jgi:hypothetical protein